MLKLDNERIRYVLGVVAPSVELPPLNEEVEDRLRDTHRGHIQQLLPTWTMQNSSSTTDMIWPQGFPGGSREALNIDDVEARYT